MGVCTNDGTRFWVHPYAWIPYECNEPRGLRGIDQFNDDIGRYLFVPRPRAAALLNRAVDAITDHIAFRPSGGEGGSGTIGKERPGRLEVTYGNSDYSLFHELGHCVGLGHEYFHRDWPYRRLLLNRCACQNLAEMGHCPHGFGLRSIDKQAFLESVGNYESFREYDGNSIMFYSLRSLHFEDGDFAPVPFPAEVRPSRLSPGDIALIRFLYPNCLPAYFQRLTDENLSKELRKRWGEPTA